MTPPHKIKITSDENILQFVKSIKTKNDCLLRFVFIKSETKLNVETDFTEKELDYNLGNFFKII